MPPTGLLSKKYLFIIGHKGFFQLVTNATFYSIKKQISFWIKPNKKELEGTKAKG
jgi:hypothetical protein